MEDRVGAIVRQHTIWHEGQTYVVVKRVCGFLGVADQPQAVKLLLGSSY